MSITINDESEHIRSFLYTHHSGTLATADLHATPYASTIYFVVEDDLSISFLTKQETTKCRNMIENPQVALAVSDPATETTVQLSGDVREITNKEHVQRLTSQILAITKAATGEDTPPVMRLDAGNLVAYSIKPTFARLAKFTHASHVNSLFETVTAAAS